MFFRNLLIEHTGGNAFALIVVDEGCTFLVRKVDLVDYFHTISARPPVRPYSGLRPVRAERLAALGIQVSPEHIDADGWTHPQCATCPMGWKPAASLAQAGNDYVLRCLMDRRAMGRRRPARCAREITDLPVGRAPQFDAFAA